MLDAHTAPLCGSAVFNGTMRRLSCANLARRMRENRLELESIYANGAGRDLTPVEDAQLRRLEDAIDADRADLRATVRQLTGCDPDLLVNVL